MSPVRPTLLRFTSWILIALISGCGASTMPSVHTESERLDVARQLMERHQWTAAADLLKTYVANNPGGASVDEAIYRLGESDLALKDWTAASVEFERLLRDYPESDSSSSASMRLGDALFGQARPADFDQDFTEKALQQWQSYLRDHPGHWLNAEAERKVALARERLARKLLATARLYQKLALDEPARLYYQRVVGEFGDLDVVADAWINLAELDSKLGKREEALESLRKVEERFAGKPIAAHAARERARLER